MDRMVIFWRGDPHQLEGATGLKTLGVHLGTPWSSIIVGRIIPAVCAFESALGIRGDAHCSGLIKSVVTLRLDACAGGETPAFH
jgi:hypothetical protein